MNEPNETQRKDRGWMIFAVPLGLPLLLIGVILWSRFSGNPAPNPMVPLDEASSPVGTPQIAWESSFDKALKAAGSANKLVMIDFYADG